MISKQVEYISIQKIISGEMADTSDQVAVEEPLEIRIEYSTATGRMTKNIAVTMRTPGNDEELAAGFLFTEGVIADGSAIREIKRTDENRLLLVLHENVAPRLQHANRNFYATSGCGICGKASIDAINTLPPIGMNGNDFTVSAHLLYQLPAMVQARQQLFEHTGGIHAAALFSRDGNLLDLREDVGRHNALDKLIGHAYLNKNLPLDDHVLFLSGRSGFEMVQKALMAGIRVIIAVGAASSLAIELAKEYDLTLGGFLRENRFNIYSGKQRIVQL